MKHTTYKQYKNLFLPYLPCEKGLFAYHLATGTVILIKSILEYKNECNYKCLVYQNEDKQTNFCDVTYSEKEISITDLSLEHFITVHNEFTGIQLELF